MEKLNGKQDTYPSPEVRAEVRARHRGSLLLYGTWSHEITRDHLGWACRYSSVWYWDGVWMDRVWDWLIRAQKLWWSQTAKAQDNWKTQGLHVAPQHNPTTKGKSESHSVVYNSLRPHGLYSPWNSLGQSTRVGSLSLLQGIFPTQGSNPGLPRCRWNLY